MNEQSDVCKCGNPKEKKSRWCRNCSLNNRFSNKIFAMIERMRLEDDMSDVKKKKDVFVQLSKRGEVK